MTKTTKHLSVEELEAGLENILQSPEDNGNIRLIVCRPEVDQRKVLEQGELDVTKGLVGDTWWSRGSSNPEMQINIMNARVIALLATSEERWPLAGDQLFVDLDLGEANLDVGQRLAIGDAVVEITAEPHTGCSKFAARFGVDALKFVNMGEGAQLKLRGIYAMVITEGEVHQGDLIRKL